MLTPNTIILQRYQVIRMVGQGGMGAVYEATDLRLRTTVALKQTLVSGDQLSRAFEREAQILAGLRHPALPKVIDHFMDEGGQFLVMEYIPGEDLATLLDHNGGPFPLAQVLGWADQILAALEYLHSQRSPIIHRDIKPQNLKLMPDGQIILLDFGLAKGLRGPSAAVTTAGRSLFAFTLQYAPPEQMQGSTTGPYSDIYSLAATLHALLTGKPPVDAITRATNLAVQRPDPQPGTHELNPHVPAAVGAVLLRAMALNLSDRYASAFDLRSALHAAAQASAPGPTPEVQPRPGRPAWIIPAIGGGGALALALAVGVGMAIGGMRAPADSLATATTRGAVTLGPVSTTMLSVPALGSPTPTKEPTLTPVKPTSSPTLTTPPATPTPTPTNTPRPRPTRARVLPTRPPATAVPEPSPTETLLPTSTMEPASPTWEPPTPTEIPPTEVATATPTNKPSSHPKPKPPDPKPPKSEPSYP